MIKPRIFIGHAAKWHVLCQENGWDINGARDGYWRTLVFDVARRPNIMKLMGIRPQGVIMIDEDARLDHRHESLMRELRYQGWLENIPHK